MRSLLVKNFGGLLLLPQQMLFTLTLRSPPQAGVSKGEATARASPFETRRKGDAPHREGGAPRTALHLPPEDCVHAG